MTMYCIHINENTPLDQTSLQVHVLIEICYLPRTRRTDADIKGDITEIIGIPWVHITLYSISCVVKRVRVIHKHHLQYGWPLICS